MRRWVRTCFSFLFRSSRRSLSSKCFRVNFRDFVLMNRIVQPGLRIGETVHRTLSAVSPKGDSATGRDLKSPLKASAAVNFGIFKDSNPKEFPPYRSNSSPTDETKQGRNGATWSFCRPSEDSERRLPFSSVDSDV